MYPCLHTIHISCGKIEYPGFNGDIDSLRMSCPGCGVAALTILNAPFIASGKENEEFELWDVPL
jgi:hypothetical protein